jgi:RNA polymerase sigma-70 factor (ECF subfamily)
MLVLKTKGALARYLRQYLSSTDDIQEVLQEAYLKVFCALQNDREREHEPVALLYTTVRNLALTRLRHRQLVARCNSAVTVSEELRRESKSIVQQVTRDEQRRQLLQTVNSLPPKCRNVFVLRMIDGLSHREIGERLGIAVSTVEKHLAKGLRFCKHRFAESQDASATGASVSCKSETRSSGPRSTKLPQRKVASS